MVAHPTRVFRAAPTAAARGSAAPDAFRVMQEKNMPKMAP